MTKLAPLHVMAGVRVVGAEPRRLTSLGFRERLMLRPGFGSLAHITASGSAQSTSE